MKKRRETFDEWFTWNYGKDPLPTIEQQAHAAAEAVKLRHHNEWVDRYERCQEAWEARGAQVP